MHANERCTHGRDVHMPRRDVCYILQVYISQVCISQACISQACVSQACVSQACISQACISQVCVSQVCISQVCISQACISCRHVPELCPRPISHPIVSPDISRGAPTLGTLLMM